DRRKTEAVTPYTYNILTLPSDTLLVGCNYFYENNLHLQPNAPATAPSSPPRDRAPSTRARSGRARTGPSASPCARATHGPPPRAGPPPRSPSDARRRAAVAGRRARAAG